METGKLLEKFLGKRENVSPERLFFNIVNALRYENVPPSIKQKLDMINPETNLQNKILISRAILDLKDPDGKILVMVSEDFFGKDCKKGLCETVIGGLFTENPENISGEAVFIFINPNNSLWKRRFENGKIRVNDEEINSFIEALITASMFLEKEKSLLTRRQYEEIVAGHS